LVLDDSDVSDADFDGSAPDEHLSFEGSEVASTDDDDYLGQKIAEEVRGPFLT
jgi:hypothetical protein